MREFAISDSLQEYIDKKKGDQNQEKLENLIDKLIICCNTYRIIVCSMMTLQLQSSTEKV